MGCEMRLWRKLDSEILRYEGSFLMPRRRAAATVRASSRARADLKLALTSRASVIS